MTTRAGGSGRTEEEVAFEGIGVEGHAREVVARGLEETRERDGVEAPIGGAERRPEGGQGDVLQDQGGDLRLCGEAQADGALGDDGSMPGPRVGAKICATARGGDEADERDAE